VGLYLHYHIRLYSLDRDNFAVRNIRLITGVSSHKASRPQSILAITCLKLCKTPVLSDLEYEDGNIKFLRDVITASQAHRIPQSGHLTAVEKAKLHVRSNFADSAVGVDVITGDMESFFHHVNKSFVGQYPMKTKGSS
jgi:hypothetical protein